MKIHAGRTIFSTTITIDRGAVDKTSSRALLDGRAEQRLAVVLVVVAVRNAAGRDAQDLLQSWSRSRDVNVGAIGDSRHKGTRQCSHGVCRVGS